MSNRTALAALLAGGLLAGCQKDYTHRRLGQDSPQTVQVRAMVQQLRQAGSAGLDGVMSQQAATGLSEPQRQALRAALAELGAADSAELDRVDEFGPQVYRATFKLSTAGQPRAAALLLVKTDAGLRWAGRN